MPVTIQPAQLVCTCDSCGRVNFTAEPSGIEDTGDLTLHIPADWALIRFDRMSDNNTGDIDPAYSMQFVLCFSCSTNFRSRIER